MRKIIAIATLALSACANQQNAAYEAKRQDVQAYVTANLPKAKDGTMKRSDYYRGYYEKLIQPPFPPGDSPAAKGASHMIDVATDLESGRITKQQYDSELRATTLDIHERTQEIVAQQAAAKQQRDMQVMQMYMQSKPVTTNCTALGNSATCTTY